ncbi:MAG: DUF6629 family protein [Candidatus Altimarinota bacterium]
MCFSAPASFLASGVLTGVGIGTHKQVKAKSDYALAAIPFIFAFQQAIEGAVWLTEGGPWQIYFAYAFVFFSHLFWPSFVPYAFYRQESDQNTKKLLKNFIPLGISTSLYLAIFLVLNGLNFSVQGHHLTYAFDVPFGEFSMILYLFATILPSALSTSRILKIFSLTLVISYLISFLSYREALFSVWCFLAAILSLIITLHLYLKNHRTLKKYVKKQGG